LPQACLTFSEQQIWNRGIGFLFKFFGKKFKQNKKSDSSLPVEESLFVETKTVASLEG
jgi:hypothetical protein